MAELNMSDLSAMLQNEDTLHQLREMAGQMGLGSQLENALQNMQPSAPRQNPSQQPNKNSSKNGKTSTASAPDLPPAVNNLLSNPAAIAQLGQVMQAMNQKGPEYALLSSLKPLLRPERSARIDQALQIMQMMQALRATGSGNGLSALMGLPGLMGM